MPQRLRLISGITLFDVNDPDQGIVHVISPELGIVLPGVTLVAPDSHTCTQGAFGALAWGIGSSEAEHAMATGTLRLRHPGTMRVTFCGRLAPGVTAKDMALALIAAHAFDQLRKDAGAHLLQHQPHLLIVVAAAPFELVQQRLNERLADGGQLRSERHIDA